MSTTTSSSGGALPGGEVCGRRGWDEVLSEAVAVLTEAARLRAPVSEENPRGEWVAAVSRTEPVGSGDKRRWLPLRHRGRRRARP